MWRLLGKLLGMDTIVDLELLGSVYTSGRGIFRRVGAIHTNGRGCGKG